MKGKWQKPIKVIHTFLNNREAFIGMPFCRVKAEKPNRGKLIFIVEMYSKVGVLKSSNEHQWKNM